MQFHKIFLIILAISYANIDSNGIEIDKSDSHSNKSIDKSNENQIKLVKKHLKVINKQINLIEETLGKVNKLYYDNEETTKSNKETKNKGTKAKAWSNWTGPRIVGGKKVRKKEKSKYVLKIHKRAIPTTHLPVHDVK